MFDSESGAGEQSFENPVGESFDNDKNSSPAAAVPRVHPEIEERDKPDPAREADEDLFALFQEALTKSSVTVKEPSSPRSAVERASEVMMAVCIQGGDPMDTAQWEAPMPEPDFMEALEGRVGLTLSEANRRQLAREIHAGSGIPTISFLEFASWWSHFYEAPDEDSTNKSGVLRGLVPGVIWPTSRFRYNWDALQAFLMLYVALTLPYRIGFHDDAATWSFWFIFDLGVDIYFVADLIVNFRTVVIVDDLELLVTGGEIAKHYLRTWFFLDLLSSLPFGLLSLLTHEHMRDASVLRFLRLFRLIKLLRLIRMKRVLDRWEQQLYTMRWFGIVKVIILAGLVAHWLACMWFFFGTEDIACDDSAPGNPDFGLKGCDGVTGAIEGGWVSQRYVDYTTVSKAQLYFDSLYWSTCAVLMVSIRDMSINSTTGEQVTWMLGFFSGAALLSMIIGCVSDIISHSHPGEQSRDEAIGVAQAFVYSRLSRAGNASQELTRKVYAHFTQYYTSRGTTEDMQMFFDMMPSDLRNEVAAGIGFIEDPGSGVHRSVFSKISFVRELGNDDLIAIGCKLRHVKYSPPRKEEDGSPSREGYIMREGERGTELFIVLDGVVKVERFLTAGSADGEQAQATEYLGKLRPLDVFGETAVLAQERPGYPLRRMRSAYAFSHSVTLYTLSFFDLWQLRRERPGIELAVSRAAAMLAANRPSLFVTPPSSAAAAGGGADGLPQQVAGLTDKVDALDQKLSGLQAVIERLDKRLE